MFNLQIHVNDNNKGIHFEYNLAKDLLILDIIYQK